MNEMIIGIGVGLAGAVALERFFGIISAVAKVFGKK